MSASWWLAAGARLHYRMLVFMVVVFTPRQFPIFDAPLSKTMSVRSTIGTVRKRLE